MQYIQGKYKKKSTSSTREMSLTLVLFHLAGVVKIINILLIKLPIFYFY